MLCTGWLICGIRGRPLCVTEISGVVSIPHKLLLCFLWHVLQQFLELQCIDLWLPKQLKHNLFLLTTSSRAFISVITLHCAELCGPLQ